MSEHGGNGERGGLIVRDSDITAAEPVAHAYTGPGRRSPRSMACRSGLICLMYVAVQFIGTLLYELVRYAQMDIWRYDSGTLGWQLIEGGVAAEAMANQYWIMAASMPVAALLAILLRRPRAFAADVRRVERRMTPGAFGVSLMALGTAQLTQTFTFALLETALNALGLSIAGQQAQVSAIGGTTPDAILYVCVVAPLCEETVFRGVLSGWLRPYGRNMSIALSALLFACMHMFLLQGVYAFFVGLVLGVLAAGFSWKWALALHVLNNSLSIALSWATSAMGDSSGGLLLLLFAACAIGLLVWRVRRRDMVRRWRAEGRAERGDTRSACRSLWLWVPAMLMVLTTVGMVTQV